MANPRQRRKSRSGSHTAVHHSRRAKKLLKKQPSIRGPKILQEAWDKHKTVRQNYEALGLLVSLNPSASGGVERPSHGASASHESAIVPRSTPEDCSSSQKEGGDINDKTRIPKGYGRIIRDENGEIIDVEMGDEGDEDGQMTGDGEKTFHNDIPRVGAQDELADWIAFRPTSDARAMDASETHVVHGLEELSKGAGTSTARFTSTGELAVLCKLVGKYEEDVEGMARDRKLNADQLTTGELRRAIAKAGGFERLRKG